MHFLQNNSGRLLLKFLSSQWIGARRCSIKKYSKKFQKLHRKRSSMESLFSKTRLENEFKKRLNRWCLPVNFAKVLYITRLNNCFRFLSMTLSFWMSTYLLLFLELTFNGTRINVILLNLGCIFYGRRNGEVNFKLSYTEILSLSVTLRLISSHRHFQLLTFSLAFIMKSHKINKEFNLRLSLLFFLNKNIESR